MQYVADLEPNEDGALQIMYGIDGRRDLTESIRDDLSGYDGARPVRVGNGAFDQRQNDVFGAVLDSILLHTRRSQRLPRRLWPIVQAQAECATAVWRQPDQGIWEARGEPQHYVSSKLMCWVAMDRAAQAGARSAATASGPCSGGPRPRRSAPTSSSTASATTVCCASTTTPTRWTPRRCSPRSSASWPGDDERLQGDRGAIAEELTENGYVLRYRTDETDDGLSGQGGHVPDLLVLAGLGARRSSARRRGPATSWNGCCGSRSPLGLYAEEFEVDTGRHLGQLPAGVLASRPHRGGGADHLVRDDRRQCVRTTGL